MSVLAGMGLGVGLMLIWFSGFPTTSAPAPSAGGYLRRRLDAAGKRSTSCATWVLLCLLCFVLAGAVVFLLTSAAPVALVFACFAGLFPLWMLGPAAAKRQRAHRGSWPDVVDQLRSAVRAGLPLSEALAQVGRRGPETLRQPFLEYEADLRSGRAVDDSLLRLQNRLDDPVADRIIAAVRLTREVGGADVGEMLGTLSTFLRSDIHTRGELEARQSWTINGARLAVTAPWLILLILCLQPQVAQAYNGPGGIAIILIGLVAAAGSYALMVRIARLPDPERAAR